MALSNNPPLVDIREYGIPEKIQTIKVKCEHCGAEWVITLNGYPYVLERDLRCRKCGEQLVKIK